MVRYVDQDPGDAPYATRILATTDFLRMAGGMTVMISSCSTGANAK